MSSGWERFRRALSGAAQSEIAAGSLIAADHAAELAGMPVCEAVQSADRLARVLIRAHRSYGGDFTIVFADVNVEAEAMGARLEFPDDAPPYVVEPVSPEELRETDPHRDGRLPLLVEAAGIVAAVSGDQVPVFASLKDPFSAAALACGAESFLALLIEAPDRAQRAIRRALNNQLRYLEALIAAGAHVIVGSPLASGGILGPRHFRAFAAEPIRTLLNAAHQRQRLAGVHLCGDAEPILDQLTALPADFLSLETFAAERWKALVAGGGRPVLMGWFPTGLLLGSDEQAIHREVARERATLSEYPHILATACDIPQHAQPESVRAFMHAARAEVA